MALDLEKILASIDQQADKLPPVMQWQPTVEGKIDIHIDHNMQWTHEGGVFERHALVKLFSTILRKEGEQYYLVTPVEKLAIQVDDVPFKIIAMLEKGDDIYLITNTEDKLRLDVTRDWQLRDYQGVNVPYVKVRDALYARVDRAVFYQMVDRAKEVHQANKASYVIESAGQQFVLA